MSTHPIPDAIRVVYDEQIEDPDNAEEVVFEVSGGLLLSLLPGVDALARMAASLHVTACHASHLALTVGDNADQQDRSAKVVEVVQKILTSVEEGRAELSQL